MPRVPRLHHPLERRPGVVEREDAVDLRPELPLVDQPRELDQLRAARLDHEVDAAQLPLGGGRGRLLDDRDQPPAGPQHRRRALEPLAAGGVEDEVDGLDERR